MRGRWPHPELPQPFRANETGDAAPDHRHPLVVARGHGGDDAVRTPVRRPVSLHSRDDLGPRRPVQSPTQKAGPHARPARKTAPQRHTNTAAPSPAPPSTPLHSCRLLPPLHTYRLMPRRPSPIASYKELRTAARGQQSPPRCLGTPALGPSASHRCASRRARRAQRPAATSLPARVVTRTKHSSSMSRYGVPTLRKLRFQYCDWGGSSSGMR